MAKTNNLLNVLFEFGKPLFLLILPRIPGSHMNINIFSSSNPPFSTYISVESHPFSVCAAFEGFDSWDCLKKYRNVVRSLTAIQQSRNSALSAFTCIRNGLCYLCQGPALYIPQIFTHRHTRDYRLRQLQLPWVCMLLTTLTDTFI